MRPLLAVLAAACVMAVLRNAAVVYGPSTLRPKVSCQEPVNDLGKLSGPGPVGYSFTIVNAGGRPLTIKRLIVECGCTSISKGLRGKVLDPGEQQQIRGSLSLDGIHGRFRKAILIETDDPRRPVLQLQLVGIAPES